MSDSVYRKTPLPVKLNLNDRNTREQLTSGTPEESSRGTLEGAGLASTASQSQKNCTDVMRKDLKDWLVTHEIRGPPPSAEAEQRAMWQWIRDFHKEYNDDWFSRNMPRLHEQFRPVFLEEMKSMKKQMAAEMPLKAPANVANCNLLDFEPLAVGSADAGVEDGRGKANVPSSDLLSMDGPSVPPLAPAAVPTPAQPHGGNNLLDLDLGGPPLAPGLATAPGGPLGPSSDLPVPSLAQHSGFSSAVFSAGSGMHSKDTNLLDLMM